MKQIKNKSYVGEIIQIIIASAIALFLFGIILFAATAVISYITEWSFVLSIISSCVLIFIVLIPFYFVISSAENIADRVVKLLNRRF